MDELAGEESAATSKQEKLTAKAKKQQAVAEEDEEEADSSDEDEDAAYLHGFSDDGADSSDEEEDDVENIKGMVLDITKLPTIAKDDETVKRKLDRAKKLTKPYKGVICIGRLPHGFYEDQLRAYFSQFGEVSRLRVSRNKKTGASKHYAFLEFESVPVATIVAETMNNYLIHGHILKCELLPKEKVHPDLWIGANRKWRKVPMDRVRREEHNRPRTEDEREKASSRLLKRQAQKKRKLEDSGIKYDFDAVAYVRGFLYSVFV
ncbi:hypothetical protein BDV98DRAFT_516674 [Pterulicium gracile]|uniref:RRM domain-containing protein n=1 Tax=Pterulicium gracile TaxID=1884261 RepID=A0A5C3Q6G3_9AGAR|nr:hypothetical protein BDV98DRAFT_516674 [Pterula gracilis]